MELWISQKKNEKNKKYREQFLNILLESGLILVVFGVGSCEILKLICDSTVSWIFILFTWISAFMCLIFEKWKRFGLPAGIATGVICFTILFLLFERIQSGMTEIWNEITDVLGSKAGIYLTRYASSGNVSEMDLQLFWSFMGLAAGLLGVVILKMRISVLMMLWGMIIPVLIFGLDVVPDGGSCAIFYVGIFLEIVWIRSSEEKELRTGNRGAVFIQGMLCIILVTAVAAFFFKILVPEDRYVGSELVVNARQELLEKTEELCYGKGRVNSLPNGKLKTARAWTASDNVALSVKMEHPDSLYLRGFVGSTYDGNQWSSIAKADAWKEKNLFYWLHQDGFYGLTQLANVRQLVQDNRLSDKEGEISIVNKRADSRYLYTPYEMTELPEGYEKETPLTDSTLAANGLFGQRKYSVKSLGNLVKDFTVLGAESYQALAKGNETGYREAESYYNTFVYAHDTEIPQTLKTLFQKELGDAGNREQGHTDYYTAISRIRSYLEENMTYSTATDVYNGKGDFVENFLTESKIGHSVHYATAAALMFRYYGIPSRYVEGYLITPEAIKGKKDGDTIAVSGKDGHAWTEIYVDGMGWVPVEMTPEYYNVMEEPDLTLGLETKGSKTIPVPKTDTEKNGSSDVKTHWNLRLAIIGLTRFLVLLLVVFDFFCLVFFLTVCALRICAILRRRKVFGTADSRNAVRAMTGYAAQLYIRGNYSQEVKKLYRDIYRIGEKAAFSRHPISEEEQRKAQYCVRRMKQELREMTSWYELWIMKYIERLL